jgi:hypothetical protein
MNIHPLPFRGHYEESIDEVAETLQVVAPESDLERDVLSWAILRNPERIIDDRTRPAHTFNYELGKHLDNGLFVLRLTDRDPAGKDYSAEITAALVATVATEELTPDRKLMFSPCWFINKSLHYRVLARGMEDYYPGAAFGRLDFDDAANLPERRLFLATATR